MTLSCIVRKAAIDRLKTSAAAIVRLTGNTSCAQGPIENLYDHLADPGTDYPTILVHCTKSLLSKAYCYTFTSSCHCLQILCMR